MRASPETTPSPTGPRPSRVAVIGAPMDLGSGRRGVDMGPSAVRVANLGQKLADLGYKVQDLGNVQVEQPESLPASRRAQKAKYLPQIAKTCQRLARKVEQAMAAGRLPLVLGGDHSIAAGTVAGVAHHYRKQGQQIGLLWVDAHSDINTPETTPSGNVHGMPLACVVGLGPAKLAEICGFRPKVDPSRVALVGVRDVDPAERRNLESTGVRVFTMRDIDERGMRTVMEEALRLVNHGTAGFHLSLDMDAVDPSEAPGVGTPVPGGITYREAHLAMEMAADTGRLVSMEVVEVNPVIDEHNRTARLAVELALSALGKRIL